MASTATKSGAAPKQSPTAPPPTPASSPAGSKEAADPKPAAEAPKPFKLSDLVTSGDREIIFPPFDELTMLIYGAQGSGKTSLFGLSGAAFIVATEPGAQFQKSPMRQVFRFSRDEAGVDKRLDFCSMVQGLVEANAEKRLAARGIKVVVIDTIDRLHQLATTDVCQRNAVAEIGDMPFGKGYALALNAVKREVMRLQAISPVAFISHSLTATEELESASGVKKEVEKLKPSVDRRVGEWLAGEQNVVGYTYKSADGKFLVKFHSDPRLETKDRTGILEGLKKPLPTDWATVVGAYEARAKELGIQLRSRFR